MAIPEASGLVTRPAQPARRIYVRWGIPHLSAILCASGHYSEIEKSARRIPVVLALKCAHNRAAECLRSHALQGLKQLAFAGAGGPALPLLSTPGIEWWTYTEKRHLSH
jgi:hypothetical protein